MRGNQSHFFLTSQRQMILIGPIIIHTEISINIVFSKWTDTISGFKSCHFKSNLCEAKILDLHDMVLLNSAPIQNQSKWIQCAFISQKRSDWIVISASVSIEEDLYLRAGTGSQSLLKMQSAKAGSQIVSTHGGCLEPQQSLHSIYPAHAPNTMQATH